MVDAEMPVAATTTAAPPRPSALASEAAQSRRARSLKAGDSALNFDWMTVPRSTHHASTAFDKLRQLFPDTP